MRYRALTVALALLAVLSFVIAVTSSGVRETRDRTHVMPGGQTMTGESMPGTSGGSR